MSPTATTNPNTPATTQITANSITTMPLQATGSSATPATPATAGTGDNAGTTARAMPPSGERPPGRRMPQPTTYPLIGNALEVDPEAPVKSMNELAERHGPIYRLSLPGEEFVVVGSVEYAAEACDETRFEKKVHASLEEVRAFTGDALFTAHGHEPNWGRAHRILMPAFGPTAMRDSFADMLDIAEQLCVKWERQGPDQLHDVPDEMTRLTLDTIALSGFGYRFNSFYREGEHPFVSAMFRCLVEAGKRSVRLPGQTAMMPWLRWRFDDDVATMNALCDELVARRRAAGGTGRRDLLELMLHAADPLTGERLDDVNIRHQLITFLIAGHETTSGMLSFAVHLLLDNPEILERARTEVDRVLGDRMPRFEDMSQLGYIDQVLRETLRIHPTAPMFGVRALHDTTIGGHEIAEGTSVFVLVPTVHRDPLVWEDPERFDPDRFAPDRIDRIPARAWLPFGNGQRACIGRAFAMQEATLVIAMLLQRFDLARPAPYTLQVKEALTMKPAGLSVSATVRRTVRAAEATPADVAASTPSQQVDAIGAGTALVALYGSNTGSSEAIARRIAGDASARGFDVSVAPLDEWGGSLPVDGLTVVVTASYNGEAPDNARRFVQWVRELAPGSLSGTPFAVLGCGSTDWPSTYQAVPKEIDDALATAGATRIRARGEANAARDFFGDVERWYAAFWEDVSSALGIENRTVDAGPLYEIEVSPEPATELALAHELGHGTVVANRELVDMTAEGARSKRHIEIELPDGVEYQTGDYLIVLPENQPELVDRVLLRYGLSADATVTLRSSRAAATALPIDRPMSIGELLRRHVELSTPATQRDIALMAEHNPCPPHRADLQRWVDDAEAYRTEVFERRLSVLDVLEIHASTLLPLPLLLELLPVMRVRQYSISSAPHVDAERCSLTIAVVDAPAWSGRGRFRGTASTYLATCPVGARVAVGVRRPSNPFHPPVDNATPMIMACAGTGLAPFRGFLQERAARHAAGETAGPALLFFGCDHPDIDLLYRDEIAQWERDGIVELLPAFFLKPDNEITFVQHRIAAEADRVLPFLREDAPIFVCGDGRYMAPAVEQTFTDLYRQMTGCSEGDASAWMATAKRDGRYVADVFS